jgi:hypothetical protein
MILFLRISIVIIAGFVYAYYHIKHGALVEGVSGDDPIETIKKLSSFHNKFIIAHIEILIVVVIELLIYFWEAQTKAKSILASAEETLKNGKAEIISVFRECQKNKFSQIKDNLNNPNLRECANAVFTTIEDNITSYENGFEVTGSELALFSYLDFWGYLKKEQERRNNTSQKPLFVALIHSCDFKIWTKHALSDDLLQAQKQFISAGGNMLRILCSDTPKPQGDCLSAFQAMQDYGIPVAYYYKSTGAGDFQDFAFAEELNIALEWVPFGATGTLKEAKYYGEIKSNFKSKWKIMQDFIQSNQHV